VAESLQSEPPRPADEMFATACAELHRLARSRLRDGGRNTVLDTTAPVHEASCASAARR
jgi:hypothetical protein